MDVYIGLDIGGTKILGALYNEEHQVIKTVKKKSKANKGIETVIEQIFKVIDELVDHSSEINAVLKGIGAGAPGIVIEESIVTFAPNLPFKDFDLGKLITERYDVPFVLGNDVNVAMFGEWKATDIADAKNILGVFVGTGLGGALILDGKLYTGQGGAGEIGHMVINPGGVTCGCGSHGCLEAYSSKTGMQKAIVAGLKKGRESVLAEYLDEDGAIIKSSSLRKAYELKDPLAVEVIEEAMRYLGVAMANLVNIFHPDLIILGGGVMESMGDELLPLITSETARHTMPGMIDNVRFVLSHLSDEAGIFGSYQLILDQEASNPA